MSSATTSGSSRAPSSSLCTVRRLCPRWKTPRCLSLAGVYCSVGYWGRRRCLSLLFVLLCLFMVRVVQLLVMYVLLSPLMPAILMMTSWSPPILSCASSCVHSHSRLNCTCPAPHHLRIIRGIECIVVDRAASGSHDGVFDAIKRRAKGEGGMRTQVVIFPEGEAEELGGSGSSSPDIYFPQCRCCWGSYCRL